MVPEIENCLAFWVDRMGFQKVVVVPDGARLGFVILVRDGAELMLQTLESVSKDVPQFAPSATVGAFPAPASLFLEVDDFEDTLVRLRDYPVALPERTTFYGMREIGVFDPAGHTIVFAARKE